MQKTDSNRNQNRLQAAKDTFMQVLAQQGYPTELASKLAFAESYKDGILTQQRRSVVA